MFKDLSLESRNIQTQYCAPIQCTVSPRNGKNLTEKLLFSVRDFPSKLKYIGAEGAFGKFLGSVTDYGYLKKVEKGTLWVGKGSNPRGAPPLIPPLTQTIIIISNFHHN